MRIPAGGQTLPAARVPRAGHALWEADSRAGHASSRVERKSVRMGHFRTTKTQAGAHTITGLPGDRRGHSS